MKSREIEPDVGRQIFERVPPQSIETEAALLGCILSDPDAHKALELVAEDCFYLTAHRLVYSAMRDLAAETEPIDSVTVAARLQEKGKLEAVGGRTFLALLSEQAGLLNTEHYAKILQEHATRRRFIHAGADLINRAYDPRWTIDELVKETIPKLKAPSSHKPEDISWKGGKFMRFSTDEPDWIVEPFACNRDLIIVNSGGGIGKTWLLCQLAIAAACGRLWLGRFEVPTIPTLYADFDGHADGSLLRRRMRKIAAGMDIDYNTPGLDENLFIMTRYHMPRAIDLRKGEHVTEFKAAIKDRQAQLVIIDTLKDVHGADNENDAGQMGIVMNRLKEISNETGACLFVAHHDRKSLPGSNGDGVTYRGSTIINDSADGRIELKREKQGIIRVIHAKPRQTKQLDDFAVSISDIPDGVIIQCEDEDKLEANRKQICAAWLLHDLWDTDESQIAAHNTDGRILQKVIIRLAEEAKVSSDKVIRDCLKEHQAAGRMDYVEGTKFGKRKCDHFWGLKAL